MNPCLNMGCVHDAQPDSAYCFACQYGSGEFPVVEISYSHGEGKKPQSEAQARKDMPIYSGVLAYFPDAIAAVARLSKVGNDQHNPGEPMHWAKDKSTDHEDCLMRHLKDHARGDYVDTDDQYHLTKVAWRALAALQIFLEKQDD